MGLRRSRDSCLTVKSGGDTLKLEAAWRPKLRRVATLSCEKFPRFTQAILPSSKVTTQQPLVFALWPSLTGVLTVEL